MHATINLDYQQTTRELRQEQANREELVERIGQAVPGDGTLQPLAGLYLYRSSVPFQQPVHSVTEPSVCVIAQGSKEVLLGKCRYIYDAAHYLLSTIELPHVSQVLEASQEQPYLSLRLVLPPDLVSSVLVEANLAPLTRTTAEARAIAVSSLEANLLDAFLRIIRLMDNPDDASVLLPLFTREIIYRLLQGEQGPRLCYITHQEGFTPHIAQAIQRLRQDFNRPLHIEELAQEFGMSVSGFYHHFKAVTAMSPLQFQKRLRLQEARRLMLSEDFDAASAAYQVGYQDASHFNREYKSLFGTPPMHDVQRLRTVAGADTEQHLI